MAKSMVPWALLWLLVHVVRADVDSCNKLADEPLSTGFWRAAVIMDSLDVHLGKLQAAPLNRPVHLTGLCDEGRGLQSSQFKWEEPSSFGGDWIANTDSSQIAVHIGDERCALTGLAMVTASSPSLRLQFEKCAGRAAVEVPLFSKKSGIKLMQWICGVSSGTELCSKAAKLAGNASIIAGPQETLNLMPLVEAASKGVLHTNAKSECFDELHWFVVSGGLGVDESEWPHLQALFKLLKNDRPVLRTNAAIEVEQVCFTSCTGAWDQGKCGQKPDEPAMGALFQPSTSQLPLVPASLVLSRERLGKFSEELTDPYTGPWLWISLAGACSLGICAALMLFPLFRSREPVPKAAPRLKQVEVTYPDQTLASAKLTKVAP